MGWDAILPSLNSTQISNVYIWDITTAVSTNIKENTIILDNLPIGIFLQIVSPIIPLRYRKSSISITMSLNRNCSLFNPMISDLIVGSKVGIFLLHLKSVSMSMIFRCLMIPILMEVISGSTFLFRGWNRINSTLLLLSISLKLMRFSTMGWNLLFILWLRIRMSKTMRKDGEDLGHKWVTKEGNYLDSIAIGFTTDFPSR